MTMMRSGRRWVRTVRKNVGFMYEPGAIERSRGAIVEYIAIGPEGVLISKDAAHVAVNRFNGVVVYGKS